MFQFMSTIVLEIQLLSKQDHRSLDCSLDYEGEREDEKV